MQQTILIVDDSGIIRRMVGLILRNSGYQILQAADGQEGFEVARTHKPDLVIMDIEMPVMNGIESTRRIKTDPETKQIPVLMLTALGREEDIRHSMEAGCSGFLNKPIGETELVSAIQAILQGQVS